MNIKTHHPQYDATIEGWKIVTACCEGPRAVKELGTEILPPPDMRVSEHGAQYYDEARYKRYIQYANYLNVTGRTLAGLKGAATRNPPQIKLQPGIEHLEKNADGGGTTLAAMVGACIDGVIKRARHILVVDAAKDEGSLPYIKQYRAEAMINWRDEIVDGVTKMVMAVFEEKHKADDSKFSHRQVCKYRLFEINEAGVYQQSLFSINDKGEEILEDGPFIPLDYNGNPFTELPITTPGSVSNNSDIDPIPLEDIAWINIGHFRNSADLEENNFYHGQLTLGVASSLSFDQFKEANPNGIMVGARSGHFLGEGGQFTFVQAGANQLADKLMERKERQMLMMGARLIEKGNPNTTATAASIEATGENSALLTMVENIESALNQCLGWCVKFGAAEEADSTITMNREFFPENADSQTLMAFIQMYDRKIVAASDVQALAKDSGILSSSRSSEDIKGEAGDPIYPLDKQTSNNQAPGAESNADI